MAIDMTPEQKEIGKGNFQRVVGTYIDQAKKKEPTRRDFMKGLFAAGAVVPIGAAAYFGYESLRSQKPVKAAMIGTGDEGGVLMGEHNPDYLEFIAICDIRPSNRDRIFTGEPRGPRKGLLNIKQYKDKYGNDIRNQIKQYTDIKQVLEDKDVEAVVIALPLHLHAPVAIECMKAGKHVLCEKLMAWNITQCKEMIKVAEETDRVLAIGHQRHYSMLYAYAFEVLQSGVLGDVKHIRALWHRNNTWPELDKAGNTIPDPETGGVKLRDSWRKEPSADDRKALEAEIKKHGYKSMEELVRWRLFNRTGGGLMAELGSHQLDACSIFLGKVHPLAVSGTGGKYFYKDDRECEDHVYCTFEFPGRNYYDEAGKVKDKHDIVVVNYSSINTNSFEPYGECVMGTRGTLITQEEQEVMLYPAQGPAGGRATAVTVTTAKTGQPVLSADPSPSGPSPAQTAGAQAIGGGPVSRGYKEEMEHFAYCIRMREEGASKEDRPKPRCHGRVAMADAIIALTSNQAMRKGQRIEFQPDWFKAESAEVPDKDMIPEVVS